MFRIRLTWIVATLAMAGVAGCRQQTFMTEADFKHCRSQALTGLKTCLPEPECDSGIDCTEVSTVVSPEGKRRLISLAECVALALENGRTGEFLDRASPSRSLASPSNLTDSIRVLSYDPAVLGTEIEQSLSKFDAIWRHSMSWNKVDRPIGTALESIQAEDTIDSIQQESAAYRSDLLKPLPTGGVAGITFRTDYNFTNLEQRVNPAYTPSLEFSIEQPLLQGGGVGINQLRTTHPGGLLNQIPTGGRVPGILLTRIFYDEAQVDFERRVHELLFAVEQAYWQLYAAYYDLYSRETAQRQAFLAWQVAKDKFDVGRFAVQDFAQIEQQLHNFRAQRVQAMGRGTGRFPGVLEAERRLRYMVGMPLEDGCRLVPVDVPVTAEVQADWCLALKDAMNRRPELIQARQEIQASQLALLRDKDFLLPDLRFFGTYDINAIGSHLDGKGPGSALRNLAENRFNNWTMGLRFDMPIGHREAHAEVMRGELQLAQRFIFLRDQESRVGFALQRSYRELVQFHREVRIQRARRLAAATELQSRYQLYLAGSEKSTIDVLLESQRNWADALRDEYFAIVDYNIALADFERQKGTIMQYDNVSIAEGPLPACAQARASAHIREFDRGIVLKKAVQHSVEPLADPAMETVVTRSETGAPAVAATEETAEEVAISGYPAKLPEAPDEPAPIHVLIPEKAQEPELSGPLPTVKRMRESMIKPAGGADTDENPVVHAIAEEPNGQPDQKVFHAHEPVNELKSGTQQADEVKHAAASSPPAPDADSKSQLSEKKPGEISIKAPTTAGPSGAASAAEKPAPTAAPPTPAEKPKPEPWEDEAEEFQFPSPEEDSSNSAAPIPEAKSTAPSPPANDKPVESVKESAKSASEPPGPTSQLTSPPPPPEQPTK